MLRKQPKAQYVPLKKQQGEDEVRHKVVAASKVQLVIYFEREGNNVINYI